MMEPIVVEIGTPNGCFKHQNTLRILAQPKKPQGFAELFWCGQEVRSPTCNVRVRNETESEPILA
jgi:hypothetical protein